MSTYKFEQAKNKIILAASNKAAEYLLNKYGSAHLTKAPIVELTHQDGPTGGTYLFSGAIKCFADVEMGKGFSTVGVGMTVANNELEISAEEDIQANIENTLNSASEYLPTDEVVTAALDSFSLTDDGTPYLKVSHTALNEASLGQVGKNEYATSPNKSELLQSIVTDSMNRTSSQKYSAIEFTGTFVEPKIEKKAYPGPESEKEVEIGGGPCASCGKHLPSVWGETHCKECSDKMPKGKPSWLTSDLEMCPNCTPNEMCSECQMKYDKEFATPSLDKPTMTLHENMPRAKMSDHLAQSLQLEDQKIANQSEKIKTEAVNSLVGMLQGMGYGSSKVAEITESKTGYDVMTTVDADGALRAVSIPVTVKEGKVILPKKALVSELIHKGLDIQAKLTESFSQEVLNKITSIEEKVTYEADEAQTILNERPTVKKEASGFDNTQYMGDQEYLELQKHLIPNHEDLKKGDKISDGSSQWEIVDTEWQQNDKNEGSASIWRLRKCEQPKSDDKEPETKIKI